MEEREQSRKEVIREAATKVISRKGFFQTRPKEVAEEAGISVGTIYNYYESKQEILLDIFHEEFADRRDLYEELSRGDLPLIEQIKKILERHFSRLTNHKELMRVIIQERFKPGSKLGRELNRSYSEVIYYIEKLIERAIEEGQIRACNPTIVASALFGAVESTIAVGILKDEANGEKLFELAPEELAQFFWNGLKKSSKGGS
ncbi:TetR/AcrR family transcriptional regulator [Candidatus Bipolaricaulota bacterium]|nr:TetR/AcrR family transcriptional regulator [Candidatus Bipolaricaulota bacterium]MBS3814518.1 TetR/AcrR family transcriptional regulator [Candidatus Bipolaricaulota bacterium]MBS3825661.1 TetR/AcrR family transcriptional regulator [Candidatus Bipolaricaulota bacterium]